MKRHAEIAGGGFGGLIAAIALAQRGWTVRVHERTPFIRAEGFGIAIHQNGIKVLEALGVFEAIRKGAMRVGYSDRWNARGEHTARFPVKRTYRISRHLMVQELASTAQSLGVEILTDSPVAGADASGELVLESGRRLRADLVIGADGYNSKVRDSLGLLRKRNMLRDGAMRMVIPRAADETAYEPEQGAPSNEYWSGTRRIIYNACARDEIYIAMSALNDDAEAKHTPIRVDAWKKSFPHIEGLFDRIHDHTDWERVKYVQFQIIKLKRWSQGRVAILGDAANAMPPNLGQGGGVAMMNALALAVHLESEPDLDRGLARWEATERPLTEHTQRWSWLYSAITFWPDALRSLAFGATGRFDWLRAQYQRTSNHIPTGCS